MTGDIRLIIGILVYNGENFLRQAIESILSQTVTDFRLVISDNASTDTTQAICEEFVKRDPRITYVRQPENIGGALNHNYLSDHYSHLAPYFKWQAHDDTIATYLEQCLALLEANSHLAIAHCRSYLIDQFGQQGGTLDGEMRLNAPSPSQRFWRLLWANYFTEVFGVVRSSLMRQTKLQGCFAGADRNFMAEMVFQGDVGYVEEYLFSRRDHPDCYCRLDNAEAKQLWFGPKTAKSKAKYLSLIKTQIYFAAIVGLPPSITERLRCITMLGE